MKKKSFTLIEMMIVIIILGIVFAMSRSYFNFQKQQKLVFAEQCVNYVFGKIDRFLTDAQYGKLQPSVTGASMLYQLDLGGSYTGNYSSGMGYGSVRFQGFTAVDTSNYTEYASGLTLYSSNVPAKGILPGPCNNPNYTIIAQNSLPRSSERMEIGIPEDSTKDWFIGEERETDLANISTGDVTYSVCGFKDGPTNPSGETPIPVVSCIEVAKIYADKRSKKVYPIKCTQTNSVNGICQSRPTIN